MTLEQKRNILTVFKVKILALPDNYRFTCNIDTELTSEIDEVTETQYRDWAKEFETKHPELIFRDVVDLNVQLPEDTPFGRLVNRVKSQRRPNRDLVTIERTSG